MGSYIGHPKYWVGYGGVGSEAGGVRWGTPPLPRKWANPTDPPPGGVAPKSGTCLAIGQSRLYNVITTGLVIQRGREMPRSSNPCHS